MKLSSIFYLISTIIFAYIIVAVPVSNYISSRYGYELNEERIKLDLKPITQDWKLDSVVLERPVRGFTELGEKVPDTSDYRFLENKYYCQYWTNKKADKSKPYHKSKEIYFVKSFWLWQNEIWFEINYFINPNSNLADFEELEVTTNWSEKEIYGHLSHMKDDEDLLLDFDVNGFDKERVFSVLEKWNLK